jgi:1-aminocyclopropane-1-carboxylate deaminase/D-cysteine desulfhydrase-like pyridoxal-dependent ACC family enzyme
VIVQLEQEHAERKETSKKENLASAPNRGGPRFGELNAAEEEAMKARLQAEHATLDPFELKKSIETKLKKFLSVLGNLDRESTKT